MDDIKTALREAFEEEGYDVSETSVNRDRVRVAVLDESASAEDLRSITHDTVDEDDILGLDVTTETGGDGETVSTVVSFRYRG